MYYDKKYLTFYDGISQFDDPPKLYLDHYLLVPNLKTRYKDNYSFNINVGIYGLYLSIEIKWGHIERLMNEREMARHIKLDRLRNKIKINKDL